MTRTYTPRQRSPHRRKRLDYAAMREHQQLIRQAERKVQSWNARRKQRLREGYAFVRITGYLRQQAKLFAPELQQERDEAYVTRFYGCETSWPRIERAALYNTL